MRSVLNDFVVKKKITYNNQIMLSTKRSTNISIISRFLNFLVKKSRNGRNNKLFEYYFK